MVVLVGTSGSGKTTYRRALVGAGYPVDRVVSLDDLRRALRDDDRRRGRPQRPLQDYSVVAARIARRRSEVMAALGLGYVADATHLIRRDRRAHVAVAAGAGLVPVAVLTPLVELAELARRNDARPDDERVPDAALLRQRHRRSLLSPGMLLDEGFVEVRQL